MANDFESILKETLLIEGGYSFDPSDNGGETLFGIARVKNPGWAGWKEVDSIIRNKGYDKHNRDNWATGRVHQYIRRYDVQEKCMVQSS
jgi:lysozyme family protein